MTDDLIPMNDLKRESATSSAVLEAVSRVVSSGWFILGPETEALEREIGERLGAFVVAVASGTDALILAGRALGLSAPSTRVATVANAGGYGCVSIVENGAIPVPLDVDANTLLASLDQATSAVISNVDGVIIPHLYGNVAPVDEIVKFARSRGTKVIEDCAQAFGATRGGRPVGTLGDAGTLSFFPTKNLAALGDGGAVVTTSRATAEKVKRLRQYGWGAKYHVTDSGGVNSRLDEIQAAILRVRIKDVDANNDIRREIVSRYHLATAASPDISWVTQTTSETVAHLAVLRSHLRTELALHLSRFGIRTDIHYPVVDGENGALAQYCAPSACENAKAGCGEILTIPCFPAMTEAEIKRVCQALTAFGKRDSLA
jgi:aminotransferase EvaB